MKYEIQKQDGGTKEIEADSYAFDPTNKDFITFWKERPNDPMGRQDAVLTLRSVDVAGVEVKAEEG